MKYYIENDNGDKIEVNKFEYYTVKALKFMMWLIWVSLLLVLINIII